MKILSIETSCDETAIAIADFLGSKKKTQIKVLSHIVLSQVPVHKKFGGVVPNLAKREHQRNLVPILLQALREAKLSESGIKNQESWKRKNTKSIIHDSKFMLQNILERELKLLDQFKKRIIPLPPPDIDAIAVTYGPGLAPALWVGVNFAKALAFFWKKPLIPVNHMAGHFYSAFLKLQAKSYNLKAIIFPALALLVSGNHTELVVVRGHGKFKVIGETLDDAAGEAFDKVARILGLPYPGGPEISRLAAKKSYEVGLRKISLPRPMLHSKDYNFSFSGLKTAVLYLTRDLGKKKTRTLRSLIAKEFQDAAVEVLVKKTIRAAKEYKVKTILLGGGVAANEKLRKVIGKEIEKQLPATSYQLPAASLTGDNALMIAVAAHFVGKKKQWHHVQADANLHLGK